jgi:hypothetical protein
MEVLIERFWKGSQSLQGELITKREDGVRFRATLNRDAYDSQSQLHVFSWGPSGWTLVTTVPLHEWFSRRWSYVERSDEWMEDVRIDLRDAVRSAAKIVPVQWVQGGESNDHR